MTIFEAINEFIKEKHYNTITIKKARMILINILLFLTGKTANLPKQVKTL